MPVREIVFAPNKILRRKSRRLSLLEITSDESRSLVSDIYETLKAGEYGVGMSAVQVGEPLAVIVVMIRPTPNRPNLKHFSRVYFNPKIVEAFGEKEPMWEGCCSVLGADGKSVYAKVPRYKKICVEYYDEPAKKKKDTASGFLAHVLQHEIDHINGVIFTDLVAAEDIVSWDEYRKIIRR